MGRSRIIVPPAHTLPGHREGKWKLSQVRAEQSRGADRQQRPLRSRRWRRLTASVRLTETGVMNDAYICDIPVYRCREQAYYHETERKVAAKIEDMMQTTGVP